MAVAQNVIATVNFNFTTQQTQTAGNINAAGSTLNPIVTFAKQYVNAQGVNYGVDQLYALQITLASTTQTVHFETASAKDPFGNTLAMLRIRDLIVQNTNTTLGQILKVYQPASNGVTWLPLVATYLTVWPGSQIWLNDSLSFGGGVGAVVGATSDGITFDSASATVTFNVLALGNSAA